MSLDDKELRIESNSSSETCQGKAQRDRGYEGIFNRVWISEIGGDAGGGGQPSDFSRGDGSRSCTHGLDNEASEYRVLRTQKL